MRRAFIILGLIAAGVATLTASFALWAFFLGQTGFTRGPDNMFGDQYLKTTVALVELHKVRNGAYPHALSDLQFVGEWDRAALMSVKYCAADDGQSYFVEVSRGWMGRPNLAGRR